MKAKLKLEFSCIKTHLLQDFITLFTDKIPNHLMDGDTFCLAFEFDIIKGIFNSIDEKYPNPTFKNMKTIFDILYKCADYKEVTLV